MTYPAKKAYPEPLKYAPSYDSNTTPVSGNSNKVQAVVLAMLASFVSFILFSAETALAFTGVACVLLSMRCCANSEQPRQSNEFSWTQRALNSLKEFTALLFTRKGNCYTESDSKIGRCQEGAQNLGQAKPASKQLNLEGLAMQTDPKFCGCPTPVEPIFESRSVYKSFTPVPEAR